MLLAALLSSADVIAQQQLEAEDGPVYLAFAGPYSSSPPSAFGHLFLVLPRDSAAALPLWDVVSFAAETGVAGPLRFLTLGIAGGFLGRYQRLAFHEKTHEYELLDDRDLWLTEVVLTPAQRSALARELAETAGRWYPYTFFERNCAYYLQELLARVVDGIPSPSGPTSPTGVFQLVLRSGTAGRSYFRPAASRRLEEMSVGVGRSVDSRLRAEDWRGVAADTAWLKELSVQDRRFVQTYLSWRAQQDGFALSESVNSGMALLRLLNAGDDDGGATVPSATKPGMPIPAPSFHGYPRASFSYVASAAESRAKLRFRPALHDDFDPWTTHRPVNTLEFLAVEASVAAGAERLHPRLESVTLFSQRSLNPTTWIAHRQSWMLEVLARRGGLFGTSSLHGAARAGGGKTLRLGASVYPYALFTTALVSDGHELAIATGVDAGVLVLPMRRWRLGARWTQEHDVLSWSREHWRLEGWIRYDVTSTWGLRVTATDEPAGASYALGVDWYVPPRRMHASRPVSSTRRLPME